MIAGRDVHIRLAKDYKQEPTLITLVVPELPDLSEVLAPLHAEIADLTPRVQELSARIEAFRADAALAQYLSIRAKVRSGMLELNAEQSAGYAQMAERLDDTARALEATVAERRPLAKALAAATAQVDSVQQTHIARLADCRCKIDTVGGETIVRQLLEVHDDPDLSLIPLPMIPKILFRNDASLKFLYAVHKGTVDWRIA
jgi:predicted nuclease with TOPRIM domain